MRRQLIEQQIADTIESAKENGYDFSPEFLNVVKSAIGAIPDRCRPIDVYWEKDTDKVANLYVAVSHNYNKIELVFHTADGEYYVGYRIEHDHWIAATGTHHIGEYELLPYVVTLEIAINFLFTEEQEAAEEAEAKKRQEEFNALMDKETKGMTAEQRMAWILGYPLRQAMDYYFTDQPSRIRKLFPVERLTEEEAKNFKVTFPEEKEYGGL